MSHRWDCPTDYEARRRGERAFERGDGSWRNPYKEQIGEQSCSEAEENWQRGYRAAERREEEHIAELHREQRRQEESRYNEAMEQQQYEQRMAEQEEPQQEDF